MEPQPTNGLFVFIDDEDVDLFICEKIVSRLYPESDVETLRSVDEAVDFLTINNTFPCYIFVDVNMPSKSGWDFLAEWMDRKNDESRVYLLTSSDNVLDIDRARSITGLDGYIKKPLTPHALDQIRNNSGFCFLLMTI